MFKMPSLTVFSVHTKGVTPPRPRVVRQHALLRRVLRRVFETAFRKGVLGRVLRRCLAAGFNERKGSEEGS